MKHKILIATDSNSDFDLLLSRVKSLLNDTHTKYISTFFTDQKQNTVLLGSRMRSEGKLEDLVNQIEADLNLEQRVNATGMEFLMLREMETSNQLSSHSSVFDLAIIDQEAFYPLSHNGLQHFVELIKCPILVLPRLERFEEILMVIDESSDAVGMIKAFLNLFNRDLRLLPLSVLVSDPNSEFQMESERALVDYLKLFFDNIGVQLMDDEPKPFVDDHILGRDAKPFMLLGGETTNQTIGDIQNGKMTSIPLFIYKS